MHFDSLCHALAFAVHSVLRLVLHIKLLLNPGNYNTSKTHEPSKFMDVNKAEVALVFNFANVDSVVWGRDREGGWDLERSAGWRQKREAAWDVEREADSEMERNADSGMEREADSEMEREADSERPL